MGKKVECPVCRHRFRKFIPYGRDPVRDNALCPNCLALERHRLLWLYLKEKTGIFRESMKFLHIAPEQCFIHRFAKLNNLEYITADLESPLASVKLDIHHIPFDDDSFDAIMCNHVLEHVDNDIMAMREIYRVLKPGGWAILQVPFMGRNLPETYEDPDADTAQIREKIYGQSDHVRIYGSDYPERLEKAGFFVNRDQYVRSLDPSLVQLYALPADETIYFCRK